MRAFFLTLALVLAAPVAHATAIFTGLGVLPGGTGSGAAGLSADGSVVVGESGSVAFRWTASSGMVDLDDLSGGEPQSSANGVSGGGTVIVGTRVSGSPSIEEAFRWTEGTGMVGLGDLPGGDAGSGALAISADGSTIVGWSLSSAGLEAFRWTSGGGMIGLGGVESEAHGVSADGSVVVGLMESDAFLWTETGGMLDLGRLPGAIGSDANAVTPDGAVVVGTSSTGADTSEAFRWTQGGGMAGLGNLPGGSWSTARAISADGSVIVGSDVVAVGGGAFQDQAVIWSSGLGPRSLQDVLVADFGLDLTGWALNSAEAVSADGRTVVGIGFNPSGQQEAWLAFLPEPSGALLLALGLAGIVGWRRLVL